MGTCGFSANGPISLTCGDGMLTKLTVQHLTRFYVDILLSAACNTGRHVASFLFHNLDIFDHYSGTYHQYYKVERYSNALFSVLSQ